MKRLLIVVLLASSAGCADNSAVRRDKYLAAGEKYFENKQYEEAVIEYRNALRLDPNHVQSHAAIARVFQSMGNHREAAAAYQHVLKLDGSNIHARLQLGNYLTAGAAQNPGLAASAQEMAEEILKAEPSNVDAHILLANVFTVRKEEDRAVQQLKQALELDPGNPKALLNLGAVLRNKDASGAEAVFREALQRHPRSVEARLASANFYSSTGRLHDAETQLRQAFELAPADARVLHALADFYVWAGKPGEAEKMLKEAAARQPGAREPRRELAAFYSRSGNREKEVEALEEVLRVGKNDREALLRLAEIDLKRNDDARAQERIRTVLAAHPDDGQAHYLLGILHARRRDFDKALAEFDEAIVRSASPAPAYVEKAYLLLARGELDAAETALQEAIRHNRSYAPAQGAYSRLLAMRGRAQEALLMARDVLAVTPGNEDALVARAEAFRLSGRLEESRSDWLALCEMSPGNARYWHRLGAVEAARKDESSALARFRKAVALDPHYAAAVNDLVQLHVAGGRFDAALAELDGMKKLAVPMDEIHRSRGEVFLANKNFGAAEAEFRRAVELNPRSYRSYILLGQLNVRRNRLPQAIREIDQLIAADSRLPAAHLLKGWYLQLSNDYPGAIAGYRKALELDPENAAAANNLAWLLSETGGNLEEALKLARLAKKKLPEEPEVADTLGWIYCKKKNYTLAVDQLLFSVNNRRRPGAEHYYRLGMAYYGKGDLRLTRDTLRKSLELDPNLPGAEEARKILAGL